MTEIRWERAANEFVFTWPRDSVEIAVRNIREDRSRDLIAELEAAELVADEHVPISAPKKVNLSSSRSIADAVRAFRLRYNDDTGPDGEQIDGKFTWADALEDLAAVVLREWRRGEPIVDLSTVDVPDSLPYLIYPYLPLNEATVFYGDGASGKSMLLMALAFAVRMGIKLPHCQEPTTTGNVLYLDYETYDQSQARRMRQVGRGLEVTPIPPGFLHRRCYRPITEDAPRLAVEIKRLRVALVIVDSLAWACGDDPNESGVAIQTMAAIRSLGVTAGVIAHIPKADRESKGKRSIFGSAFFELGPRSAWEIRAAKPGPGTIKQAIYHRKANDDELLGYPLGQVMTFRRDDEHKPLVIFRSDEISASDELASGTSLPARIRAALKKQTRPVTTGELAAYLDAKEQTVRTTLHRMDDVVNIGKGGSVALWGLRAVEYPPAAPKASAPLPEVKPEDFEECSMCHRSAPVHAYDAGGGAMCISCAAIAAEGRNNRITVA